MGGDCSLAIGALAGARRHHARVAACFLDGHVDSYDGTTSPTGEVADMDIGIVCGAGPAALRGLDGAPDPLVRPGDCVVIGNRFEDGRASADERELAHPLIQQIAGMQLRRAAGPRDRAAVAERLALQAGAIWLHIDCDVLDEPVMPAVTYAQSARRDLGGSRGARPRRSRRGRSSSASRSRTSSRRRIRAASSATRLAALLSHATLRGTA